MSKEKEEKILKRLKEDYQGFGPTLASEKLLERDGIKVSKVTVRQIMMTCGLHKPKTHKKEKVRPLREWRASQGELSQENIVVLIDLADRSLGTYQLAPEVLLENDQISVDAILPSSIEVTITEAEEEQP
jgi:hypothetical protein